MVWQMWVFDSNPGSVIFFQSNLGLCFFSPLCGKKEDHLGLRDPAPLTAAPSSWCSEGVPGDTTCSPPPHLTLGTQHSSWRVGHGTRTGGAQKGQMCLTDEDQTSQTATLRCGFPVSRWWVFLVTDLLFVFISDQIIKYTMEHLVW